MSMKLLLQVVYRASTTNQKEHVPSQEYARNRKLYGEWNYQRNKEGVERFFREGIKRMNGKEEVIYAW